MQWSSRTLGLLLASTSLSVAQGVDSWIQMRQEYCDRGNLCLTSFDWCQFSRQFSSNGSFLTGYCDRRGIGGPGDGSFFYAPGNPTTSGISAFVFPFYNLSWSGADAAYPVQVDLTFGPSTGPFNNSAPLWSRNVTGESYLYFRFRDIFEEVSDQDTTTNTSYTGLAVGYPAYFTISQPSRPPVAGINTTENSTNFSISNLNYDYLIREYDDEIEEIRARDNRKWRLGVGLGVGLGVPILLLAAFFLGRTGGKKAAQKAALGNNVSDKRVSEST